MNVNYYRSINGGETNVIYEAEVTFDNLQGCIPRDFFAITLAKKSLFYYNDVYKVQAVYKRKACTSF